MFSSVEAQGHERAILQDHAHGWIVRAVMDNRARISAFDARDHAQQGGLARSRRRHHAQARACRNMQVGVAQERACTICAVVASESLDDETAGGRHALRRALRFARGFRGPAHACGKPALRQSHARVDESEQQPFRTASSVG